MQRFRQVVHDRDVSGLNRWLEDAAASELPPFIGFTRGIAADRDAVIVAFTQPWSTGVVEGHVHKIKLLKRQAYGRLPCRSYALASSPRDRLPIRHRC